MATPLIRTGPDINFGGVWYAAYSGDSPWDHWMRRGWRAQLPEEREKPSSFLYWKYKVIGSAWQQKPVWASSKVGPITNGISAPMYIHSFSQFASLPSWSNVPLWLRPEWNAMAEKFQEKVLSGAENLIGDTLAEGDEALALIAKTARQFARGFSALRKKDWKAAAREFGVPYHRVRKTARKWKKQGGYRAWRPGLDLTQAGLQDSSVVAAQGWITWSYAIKPTLESLEETAYHLAYSQESRRWKVRSGRGAKSDGQFIDPKLSVVQRHNPTAWSTQNFDEHVDRLTLKTGAWVELTDASLHLMQQLGLTNPLAWVWERLTGSFVVDWFGNIGQMIASLDPWRGVVVQDSWTAGYMRSVIHVEYGEDWDPSNVHYRNAYTLSAQYFFRQKGLTPRPLLIVPLLQNFGDSPKRAANALSLAVLSVTSGNVLTRR